MKTTIVPAQITTVEDKIAGSLGFTQLLLLVVPVFLGAALFVVLPPFFRVTLLKTSVVLVLTLICITMAVRIKGVIVLSWILILLRYNQRPRHYLYDKNSSYLRIISTTEAQPSTLVVAKELPEHSPLLVPGELVRAQMVVDDPRAKFHIRADRKGVLRAYIYEVKEEAV